MKNKNLWWLSAGTLNLITALVHTFGGQLDLINPMLKSNLTNQVKTELLSVWHMVTTLLFITTFIFLYFGWQKNSKSNRKILSFTSYSYILFASVFVIISFVRTTLAPQWILLLPIGILGSIGIKRNKNHA